MALNPSEIDGGDVQKFVDAPSQLTELEQIELAYRKHVSRRWRQVTEAFQRVGQPEFLLTRDHIEGLSDKVKVNSSVAFVLYYWSSRGLGEEFMPVRVVQPAEPPVPDQEKDRALKEIFGKPLEQ